MSNHRDSFGEEVVTSILVAVLIVLAVWWAASWDAARSARDTAEPPVISGESQEP